MDNENLKRDIFKQTKKCSRWILLILFENFTTNLYQNRKGRKCSPRSPQGGLIDRDLCKMPINTTPIFWTSTWILTLMLQQAAFPSSNGCTQQQ